MREVFEATADLAYKEAKNGFTLPGIGKLVVDAIFWRDYPVVQTILILSAGLFIGINLLVDVLYVFLDPRIRYD